MIKKTKIVATMGPATDDKKSLFSLFEAGVDVIRLNFSHGDHNEHQKRIDNFRALSKRIDRPLAVLQDLSGPKIRIGDFYKEVIDLKKGDHFILTNKKIIGDEKRVYVNYPRLYKEVRPGSIILMDDGKKKIQVVKVKGKDVICEILAGGKIKGRRGLNLPGLKMSISSLTTKDKKDLEFGLRNNVDFFALSFVRRAQDIKQLREILIKRGSKAHIIAKIETREAVDNIDAIIALADGVMVARGDLAIEVPTEAVPLIQKDIIKKCNLLGKPVITATQMLESMIRNSVPTRAEVSDVANAILDGTDAVMLSEETTLGEYPTEAVKVMARVAKEVESRYPEPMTAIGSHRREMDTVDAITARAIDISRNIRAKLIVAITGSGLTARMLARFKPDVLIVSFSTDSAVSRKLALSFGCFPVHLDNYKEMDEALKAAKKYCLKSGMVKRGDRIVVVAGLPFNKKGTSTNMVRVEMI